MNPKVYINLPVADLGRSRAFFEALGFGFDDAFGDETALGMTINESCFAMLLTHEKFAQFTPRPIADAGKTTEVLTALQVESRDEVDRLVGIALAEGGSSPRDPQDHGFLYGRALADPDGHIWELFWMDPAQRTGQE
ncbi:MAG: VOC family protein [Kiloniellales bacterium]|nr:VOC family protein [Kiloniellales bacterium]